jgi:hypothetical protein
MSMSVPTAGRFSLASSAAFRAFATVFAIATPIVYVICQLENWPLFIFNPASNRFNLGWEPEVLDAGPAIYWFGWTASTLVAAAALGLFAAVLPTRFTRRIPLSLVWILPLLAGPFLIYALRLYWG